MLEIVALEPLRVTEVESLITQQVVGALSGGPVYLSSEAAQRMLQNIEEAAVRGAQAADTGDFSEPGLLLIATVMSTTRLGDGWRLVASNVNAPSVRSGHPLYGYMAGQVACRPTPVRSSPFTPSQTYPLLASAVLGTIQVS